MAGFMNLTGDDCIQNWIPLSLFYASWIKVSSDQLHIPLLTPCCTRTTWPDRVQLLCISGQDASHWTAFIPKKIVYSAEMTSKKDPENMTPGVGILDSHTATSSAHQQERGWNKGCVVWTRTQHSGHRILCLTGGRSRIVMKTLARKAHIPHANGAQAYLHPLCLTVDVARIADVYWDCWVAFPVLSLVQILYSSLMCEFQLLLWVFNILLFLDCISFHSCLLSTSAG